MHNSPLASPYSNAYTKPIIQNMQNSIIEEESSQNLSRTEADQESRIMATSFDTETADEEKYESSGSENLSPSPLKVRKNNYQNTKSMKSLRDNQCLNKCPTDPHLMLNYNPAHFTSIVKPRLRV